MEFILDILPNVGYCFLVLFAKVLEISIQSVKTVFMVKGQRKEATILAFIECMIWGIVISSIIDTLSDNIMMLVFYGVGYAAGLYVGSLLENKIALGTSSLQLMVGLDKIEKVEEYLSNNNYGYTVLEGRGSKKPMGIIIVVLTRKEMNGVMKEIKKLCDKEVFIISSEINKFTGGYGIRK